MLNKLSKKGLIRVAFVIYKNLNLIMHPILTSIKNTQNLAAETTTIVNSNIVGILVPKSPSLFTKLFNPIRFTFRHLIFENVTKPRCVFWDSGEWSTSGCQLVYSNSTHSVCECNHFSNFAVLMDINNQEVSLNLFFYFFIFSNILLTFVTFLQIFVFKSPFIQSFIYFGCIISLICLVITLLAFLVFE